MFNKAIVFVAAAALVFALAPAGQAGDLGGAINVLAALQAESSEGATDGVAKMYNADTGAFLFDFDAPAGGLGDSGNMIFHDGHWYASSLFPNKVVRWDLDGTNPVEVVSGTDGGPLGLVIDGGHLYIGESWPNDGISKYDMSTIPYTDTGNISGLGTAGMALGPDGNLYTAYWGDGMVHQLQTDGTELGGSFGLDWAGFPAFNPDGDLYVAPLLDDSDGDGDFGNDDEHIYRYRSPLDAGDPLGLMETIAVPKDGNALAQIAFLGEDTMFVSRKDGTGIFRFDRSGGTWASTPGTAGDAFALRDWRGAGVATAVVPEPSTGLMLLGALLALGLAAWRRR